MRVGLCFSALLFVVVEQRLAGLAERIDRGLRLGGQIDEADAHARAAFGALKRRVLADPADLGLDFDHFSGAGERELQRDAIADAAQVVRRDEHATRADVLREPRVEVVVAFEVDLHLEIEALRGANVLNAVSYTHLTLPTSDL